MNFKKSFFVVAVGLMFFSGSVFGSKKRDFAIKMSRAKTIQELNQIFDDAPKGFEGAYTNRVAKIIDLGKAVALFKRLKTETDLIQAEDLYKKLKKIKRTKSKLLSKVKKVKLAQKKVDRFKKIFKEADTLIEKIREGEEPPLVGPVSEPTPEKVVRPVSAEQVAEFCSSDSDLSEDEQEICNKFFAIVQTRLAEKIERDQPKIVKKPRPKKKPKKPELEKEDLEPTLLRSRHAEESPLVEPMTKEVETQKPQPEKKVKPKKKPKKPELPKEKPEKKVKILVYDDGKPIAFERGLKAEISNLKGLSYKPQLSFDWNNDFDKLKKKREGSYDIVFYVNHDSNFPVEDLSANQMTVLFNLSKTKTAIMCRFHTAWDDFEDERKGLEQMVRDEKLISGRNLVLNRKKRGEVSSGRLAAFSFPADNKSRKKFHADTTYNKFAEKEMKRLVEFLKPVLRKLAPKKKKRK